MTPLLLAVCARAAVDLTGFSLAAGTFPSSSIVLTNVLEQTSAQTNIDAIVGVYYERLTITAVEGLGNVKAKIKVKLVKHDTVLCSSSTISSLQSEMATAPFDGTANVVSDTGLTMQNNIFQAIRFSKGGVFKLCYTRDFEVGNWELLAVTITVSGTSRDNYKFWCAYSLLIRGECSGAAEDEDKPTSCFCRGQVSGVRQSDDGVIPLGLPAVAADKQFKIGLVLQNEECGVAGSLLLKYQNKVSKVIPQAGFEVHDFGLRVGDLHVLTLKACYCAAFDGNGGLDPHDGNPACYSEAAVDFPAKVGHLIVTRIKTKKGSGSTAFAISVYPTLTFNLVLECGNNPDVADGVGGCSELSEVRYRIIRHKLENDNLYFNSVAGCRTALESKTMVEEGAVLGGHLAPQNCGGTATNCEDIPEILGPHSPTWEGLQMDTSYVNDEMVSVDYDVCYCDGNCRSSANWFRVGDFKLHTVQVTFENADTFGNNALTAKPIVNTGVYVQIKGRDVGLGSWSDEENGPKTREMKILEDPDALVSKKECQSTPQSENISGHQISEAVHDYAEPSNPVEYDSVKKASRGHLYGKAGGDTPTIKIQQPGWVAVCYCDQQCNEDGNWAVFGRLLVHGPIAEQKWVRPTSVNFDLEIQGFGLEKTNELLLLEPENELADCGTVAESSKVFGVSAVTSSQVKTAEMLEGEAGSIVSLTRHEDGTVITFQASHGLDTNDHVLLKGVTIQQPDTESILEILRMFNKVHLVQFLDDNVETEQYKVLIPPKFSASQFPDLSVASATWLRNSKQTFKGIKATAPSPEGRGYIVCWSPIEAVGSSNFVGQVGKLTIKDPTEMPSSKLSLTTIDATTPDREVISPVVLTFRTGESMRYKEAEESMRLKLVFNVAIERDYFVKVIEPRAFDGSAIAEDASINSVKTARQHLCGNYFLELRGKENPFPQPQGCYMLLDTTNEELSSGAPGGNPAPLALVELYIVFSKKNHLSPDTEYQIVFNAKIYPELQDDYPNTGPVHVYSLDDYINRPFDVVERGYAFPDRKDRLPLKDDDKFNPTTHAGLDENRGFLISEDTEGGQIALLTRYCIASSSAASTPTEALGCTPCDTEEMCGNGSVGDTSTAAVPPNANLQWCVSPMDFACQEITGAAGSLLGKPAFKFTLGSASDTRKISSSAVLRIFLQPLTAWSLRGTCAAGVEEMSCMDQYGENKCNSVPCDVESVVAGMAANALEYQINILKITLPTNMKEIDIAGQSGGHFPMFIIGSLQLPEGGFYPLRVSAELMATVTKGARYFHNRGNQGALLYMKPRFAVASIVNKVGDGNLSPFKDDTNNVLYVKLVLGATMFSADNNKGTRLNINLPEGYECMMEAGIDAPEDLGIFEGKVPSGRGSLGNDKDKEGTWVDVAQESSLRTCSYSFLEHQILYSGTSLYFGLKANNPAEPLKQYAAANRWDVTGHVTINSIQFISSVKLFISDGDDFAPNVSVLGKLTHEVISPSSFAVKEDSLLHIFFKTEQEVGSQSTLREASIWVEAPKGFDFSLFCDVKHVLDEYLVPEPAEITQKLPVGNIIRCDGQIITVSQDTAYNRAIIFTATRLFAESIYGFTLRVKNAPTIPFESDWKLFTYETTGAAVDGSYFPVRFNVQDPHGSASAESYNLYMLPTSQFVSAVADMRPFALTRMATRITVMPLIVPVKVMRNVRVLAPGGYVWSFVQPDFYYQTESSNPAKFVPGVKADMPLSLIPTQPIVEPLNELRIDYMNNYWLPDVVYGFSTKIRVPELSPTASQNHFTIEFGYDQSRLENRPVAGTTSVLRARKLVNARVDYTSNIVSAPNTIAFFVETITEIPRGGGLVIVGPPNFEFPRRCSPKPVLDGPELPYDTTCRALVIEDTSGQSVSQIVLTAGREPISAQKYQFSLPSTNPAILATTAEDIGTWEFRSYKLVSKTEFLDFTSSVPGFPVSRQMSGVAVIVPVVKQVCTWTASEEILDGVQQENVASCAFTNWQYHPPYGLRDDHPNAINHIILEFSLECSATANPGEDCTPAESHTVMRIKAPWGFVFPNECTIVTDSKKVFDDTNTSIEPPLGFTLKYAVWPAAPEAEVLGCSGKDHVATVTLSRGLLSRLSTQVTIPGQTKKEDRPYVFRILVKNAVTTPERNLWSLEYNSEASLPIQGFPIWSFTEVSILAQNSAASLKNEATMNLVTIQLRPHNTIPISGYLKIYAPIGFLIKTNCVGSITIDQDEKQARIDEINADLTITAAERTTALNQVPYWSNFMSVSMSFVSCAGEAKPSYKVEVSTQGGRYLLSGFKYYITIEVQNPRFVTTEHKLWVIESYEPEVQTGNIVLVDSATAPGFPINNLAHVFSYVTPGKRNANDEVHLAFDIAFTEDVESGDGIDIIVPVGFSLSSEGQNVCKGYLHLLGALRKTKPVCGANMLSFFLVDDFVLKGVHVEFRVSTVNPAATPTDNTMRIRHMRHYDVKSSRVIDGYHIFPRLQDVRVNFFAPAVCHKSGKGILSEHGCRAVKSLNPIEVSFISNGGFNLVDISGKIDLTSFDFRSIASAYVATFEVSDAAMETPITEPSFEFELHEDSVRVRILNVDIAQGVRVLVRLSGVTNPEVSGVSDWRALTSIERTDVYGEVTEQKSDEESAAGFRVLGLIGVLLGSSVIPNLYTEKNAMVRFGVRFSHIVPANTIMFITRPAGTDDVKLYKFIDQSLYIAHVDVRVHGADDFFALPGETASRYFIIFNSNVTLPEIAIELHMNLPEIPNTNRVWLFDTYSFLANVDEAGEGNGDIPPYPQFLSLPMRHKATSDSLFPGFSLVGTIPFILDPQMKTPAAYIALRVSFHLTAAVYSPDKHRLEISAPLGYRFAADCLKRMSGYFSRCSGNLNIAQMTSSLTELPGLPKEIDDIFLEVQNPAVSSEQNTWFMRLYRGEDSAFSNYDTQIGYEVEPMYCKYEGNNQKGYASSGYFTFRPTRSIEKKGKIEIMAPADTAYRLGCAGVKTVGLPETPICTQGDEGEPLQLELQEYGLDKDAEYTFGIGVTNPGETVPPDKNLFGIKLQNYDGMTIDANMIVQGEELMLIDLEVIGMGWASAAGNYMVGTKLGRVKIFVTVQYGIEGGAVTDFVITSPQGTMFADLKQMEVSEALKVDPVPIINGNQLTLRLSTGDPIEKGDYQFAFDVKNPSQEADQNTWKFQAFKKERIRLSHVLAGYIYNQPSPFEVLPPSIKAGTSLLQAVSCILLLLCFYF
eukprot:GEMP01000096.1.p1 GENE.GEMP01000096.1~~GEMP01000096.1.p1  ORF type:complete len:3237 (+),score=651.26 GEMP01000096.1:50-9760(+)